MTILKTITDLAAATEADALRAEIAELRNALVWYEFQATGCRKVTSEGDHARRQLHRDGGFIARAALAEAKP